MTRHHIGKQTYDQGEWLDENTDKFNRNQNEFHPERYTGWIKNMSPVMFVGTEQGSRQMKLYPVPL